MVGERKVIFPEGDNAKSKLGYLMAESAKEINNVNSDLRTLDKDKHQFNWKYIDKDEILIDLFFNMLLIRPVSGVINIQLPETSKLSNKILVIRRISGSNNIVIKPFNGKIDDVASVTINSNTALWLFCDGTNWWTI